MWAALTGSRDTAEPGNVVERQGLFRGCTNTKLLQCDRVHRRPSRSGETVGTLHRYRSVLSGHHRPVRLRASTRR